MKNEKLLDVIGQVKEEFIEEAAPEKEAVTKEETLQEKMLQATDGSDVQSGQTDKKKKSYGWMKWAALAACGALIIGFGAPRLFKKAGKEKRSSWVDEGVPQDTAIDELLSGADTTADFTTSSPESEQWRTPDWGVVLRVKDVTPAGLTLICTREGGNATGEVDCGSDYFLSVKKGEAWEPVPTIIENYGWDAMAYWVEEGRDTVFEISWEWLYGKLPTGTYRLTKGFMDFRGTGDYDTGKYWVEFVIE